MTVMHGGYSVMALTPPDQFNWAPIESAAAVTFDSVQRQDIAEGVRDYLINLAVEQKAPSSKNMNQRLKAIHHHAGGLAKALTLADEADQGAFNAAWPWDVEPNPEPFKRILRRLSLASKGLLEANDNRSVGGRPRHEALRQFVNAVHVTWQDAGGSGKGVFWDEGVSTHRGPLISIIESLLDQIPGSQQPNPRMIAYIVE